MQKSAASDPCETDLSYASAVRTMWENPLATALSQNQPYQGFHFRLGPSVSEPSNPFSEKEPGAPPSAPSVPYAIYSKVRLFTCAMPFDSLDGREASFPRSPSLFSLSSVCPDFVLLLSCVK